MYFHQSADSFGYNALKLFLESSRDRRRVVTIYGLSLVQKERPELNAFYNLANAVVVDTQHLKFKLIEHGVDSQKLHMIPFAAAVEQFQEELRDGLIMFAGSSLINVKGFQVLAPALRMLRDGGVRHVSRLSILKTC